MSKIIACVNQKGGVGKTTTAINLAAGLRRLTGANVLFIDIDAQANATSTLLGDSFAQGQLPPDEFCVYDVLINDDIEFADAIYEADLIQPDGKEPLVIDILPANVILSSAEIDLVSIFRREYRLMDKFETFTNANGAGIYDYIVIDCPPSLGLFTLNALMMATHVLVPLNSSKYPLSGMAMLLNTIKIANSGRRGRQPLQVLGVVPTLWDRTAISRDTLEEIQQLPFKVMEPIPYLVAIREAEAAGEDMFVFAPRSKATQAYRKLVQEVVNSG